MKVKVPEVGEIEVKDISYGDARQLHLENARCFWNYKEGDSVDPEKYYSLLDKVKDKSGLKDADLKKYSMLQVDQILQQLLLHYTGLGEQKKS